MCENKVRCNNPCGFWIEFPLGLPSVLKIFSIYFMLCLDLSSDTICQAEIILLFNKKNEINIS